MGYYHNYRAEYLFPTRVVREVYWYCITTDVTIITNDGLAVGDMEERHTEERPVPYRNICIDPMIWQARFQDIGCRKDQVIKKTYKMNSVMSFGPREDVLYYENLSAIVIDIVKAINKVKKKEGDGGIF